MSRATGYYLNRVWDTVASAEVRWQTFAADPAGAYYPGPGTFGVDTSDYVLEGPQVQEALMPRLELLRGFTAGNSYASAAGALPGAAGGFLASVLLFEEELLIGVGQSLWGTQATGPNDGWGIRIEANSRRSAGYYDTTLGSVDANGGTFLDTSDSVGAAPMGKANLLVARYLPDNTMELWSDGARLVRLASPNPINPGTRSVRLGAGFFGTDARACAVAGMGYLAGTLTDQQLREYSFACMQALDAVTPPGQAWTTYSVRRGNPGATWVPSEGAGPTLTRTGALTRVGYPLGRHFV